MNEFDERYEIRLAKIQDIDSIMRFIDEHWSKGHIMSQDRQLFEYEYVEGEKVNFVLAIEKQTGEIEAIFGFIRTSHTTEFENKYIWGSMWKVNESHKNMPLLGVELARRACELAQCKEHIGNGANPKTTIPLRRLFFGEKTGKMKQYYYLNNSISEYKIPVIKEKKDIHEVVFKQLKEKYLMEFYSIEEVKKYFVIDNIQAVPYKDSWYINRRFFNHPYYKYNVYGVKDQNEDVGALLITRVVTCNGSKVLRIVDYIGQHDLFRNLKGDLCHIMIDNNYEYIDMYVFGFEEEYIIEAGFKLRTDDDRNIIPNYFEPFLQENVDIWVHYKQEGTTFFKADGDQDRPNIMRKHDQ